jgi:hypothetical protein
MKKIFKLTIAIIAISASINTNAQIIRTIAGVDTLGYTGDGGMAYRAQIGASWSCIQDSIGNVFVADDEHNLIRKIATDGTITTIAGNAAIYGGYTGDGGPATAARLNYPSGMAADKTGNIYFADNANFAIRKISPAGIITTFAGDGSGVHAHTGDGGPATAARMMGCVYVALDKFGNLFFTDGNSRVRKVSSSGIITTYAGYSAIGYAGNGVAATTAALSGPCGIVCDTAGNVYFSDQTNQIIRKISTSGIITTIAGRPTQSGFSGDGGAATAAKLRTPGGLSIDAAGNLYVADQGNNRIRMITPSGIITTVAGDGTWNYTGDGGVPTRATFKYPSSVFVGLQGNLFITDRRNYVVREILNPNTTAIAASAGSVICSGASETFTAGVPAREYGLINQWKVNGTPVGTDSIRYVTAALSTGDRVSFRRIDPVGRFTVDSSNVISMTVNPNVTPFISATKNTADTVCNGTTVTYVGHPVYGGLTPAYQWKVNGVVSGTGVSFAYTPTTGDIVNVTMNSSEACPTVNPVVSANSRMTVQHTVMPVVSIGGATGPVCEGTPAAMNAMSINGGTAPTYSWKKFGIVVATGSTFSYTPANGDYITCQMISNATCAITDTVVSNATMVVNPPVSPSVNIISDPADGITYSGQAVTYYTEVTYGGAATSYQWFVNGSAVTGATNATYVRNIYHTDTVKCQITSTAPCVDNANPVSNDIVMNTGQLGTHIATSAAANVTLFPNPNNGKFTLRGNTSNANASNATYQVYDVTGKMMAEGMVTIQQKTINEAISLGADLVPGQYFLKLSVEGDYKLISFLKK